MTIKTHCRRCPSPKCGSPRTRERTNGNLTIGLCLRCGQTYAQVNGSKTGPESLICSVQSAVLGPK
ncbi:MAG TPA: hypothetical protein PKV86_14855 [Syntrophobacteraceae bacterium]|nr:hypothetical protein [Syntrophobacteraceae bacterium]